MVTKNFLRNLSVSVRNHDKEKLSSESYDRDKKPDSSREKGGAESSWERERSKSRPKTRSTTPKQKRAVESQEEKRRSKTPSKSQNPANAHRNGPDSDSPASLSKGQAEPKTPAQAATGDPLRGQKTPVTPAKGAVSDEKAYRRRNATSISVRALPELNLADSPATPKGDGKTRQSQHPGASPFTPKPSRGNTKALPLFSIDRFREGLSVPLKAQLSYEEASGTDAFSQTSSEADGVLKLLGNQVSFKEEIADLRRQLQESEQARAEAESSKEAALALVAEAQTGREAAESARGKAEAALAQAEEFQQATELALEEAMQSFQDREVTLQEAVNSSIQKLEAVVLEKAELEEGLAARGQLAQSVSIEVEALKAKVDTTEASLAEALDLLGCLERKVKEDAESSGRRLAELRRKVTLARVRTQGLPQVEKKGEGASDNGSSILSMKEWARETHPYAETVDSTQAAQQEASGGYRELAGSLRGMLKWNSRRSEPGLAQMDQQVEVGFSASRAKGRSQFEDEAAKGLKLQAGRIEQLLEEKGQQEQKMEAVIVEALSWAGQSEILEEKLTQETQKWAAERSFLEAQLQVEDKELHSLEQEVVNLQNQVTELQAERSSLEENLKALEGEKTKLSAQALASQDQEAQRWRKEKAALEVLLQEKNKELLVVERNLEESNRLLERLEARMQEEVMDWYTERASLEAQIEAKNRELLDADDKVVTLQQQLLEAEHRDTEDSVMDKEELEAKLKEGTKELLDLEGKVGSLQQDMMKIQWEKAASEAQFKVLIAALEEERDALAAAVETQGTQAWSAQNGTLEAQLQLESREHAALQEKLANLEQIVKSLEEAKGATEAELQSAMAALDDARVKEESRSREAGELRAKVLELEQQLSKAQVDAGTALQVAGSVAKLEGGGEISESEGEQQRLRWEAEKALLQVEVEERRREAEILEGKVETLSLHISQLLQEKAGIEAQLSAASSLSTKAAAAEANLKEEIAVMEGERNAMCSEYKLLEERLLKELQKWEAERASLETKIEGKNREVVELGQKVVTLEKLVLRAEEEKGEVEATALATEAALEAQLEQKSTDLSETQKLLNDLNHTECALKQEEDANNRINEDRETAATGSTAAGVEAGDSERREDLQSWATEKASLERQLESKSREVEELDQKVISLKQQIFQLQEEKATTSEETAYMLTKFRAGLEEFDSERAAWEEERWALQFLRMGAEEVRSEHEGVKRAMRWVEELQGELEACQRERLHLNEEVQMLQEMMHEKAQAYQVERDTWERQVADLQARLERHSGVLSQGHQQNLSSALSVLMPKSWGVEIPPTKGVFKQALLQETGKDNRSSPAKSDSSGDDSTVGGVRLMSTDSGRSDTSQDEAGTNLVVNLHRQLAELQAKYASLQERVMDQGGTVAPGV